MLKIIIEIFCCHIIHIVKLDIKEHTIMSKQNNPTTRKVTIKEETDTSREQAVVLCQCPCRINSVNSVASLAVILLAAIAYVVAMATRNWSASGYKMKMGLWDFCLNEKSNNTWTCYPINTDFSVATQAFSILAAMCYACMCVLYILFFMFTVLQKSRPLTIGMCLVAFSVVSLQMMTLIVYGAKNRDLYLKIERDYFHDPMDTLYLSWSFYFAIVSTILATISGVLLFVEFRNLAYEMIYQEPIEQTGHG